ncbi:uncharacterized protein LOC114340340 [Diabrotica virgifera virgifera]|uniref:THAP-type domain-containing protein n=1 Tax=Diabrotica virgifera virgifera TaxID=50390 RepID=A0ABM5IXD1_DIAVI|nr:uncharacterized protein LOC114340340 [Diabrotica virgifera virgifera]
MSRSNRYCSVPQCSSWEKKNTDVTFHAFPQTGDKYPVRIEGKLGSKVLMKRQEAWKLKLKIGKPITKNMKVCSLHFTDDDYFYRDSSSKQRRFLKKTAVPSKRLPIGSTAIKEEAECSSSRTERLNQRNSNKENPGVECVCEEINPAAETSENEIEAAHGLLQLLQSQPNYKGPKSFKDFQVQVDTPKVSTVCDLITTDSALNSFTGLNSFKLLDTIVEAVCSVYSDQRSHRLSIKQRIFLVFTKLKCDLTYVTISLLFGISQELCNKYFNDMLPILSKVLSSVIRFTDTTEIQKNMPECFESFQNVRVVLDCTEIFIQKPKCLCCRIRFYSQYKSNNTVKFMTGISPGGLITYVSEPYGGRASDKTIFEQSNIILKLDSSKDAVMVDKGFLIDDICNQFKIELIRPPFLKNKKQFSTDEALLNAKIAAARVHIERVKQRIKIFKILGCKLQWSLVKNIKDIFTIACAITNLSSSILADRRYLTN